MEDDFGFDPRQYLYFISQINDRFERALIHLKEAEDLESNRFAAEEFCLQVRMICEAVLASSFIAHRSKYAQVIGKVTSPSDPKQLAKDLLKLNHGFFPLAVTVRVEKSGKIIVSRDVSHQVNAEFLVRVYGICGNFLHLSSAVERRPLLKKFSTEYDRFLSWMNRYLAGHALSFFQTNTMTLFDGAGAVRGHPALFNADIKTSSWTFTLEASVEKEHLLRMLQEYRLRKQTSPLES